MRPDYTDMPPDYTDIPPPPPYIMLRRDPIHCCYCFIGLILVILGVFFLLIDWDVMVAPAVIGGVIFFCVWGGCCDRCIHGRTN